MGYYYFVWLWGYTLRALLLGMPKEMVTNGSVFMKQVVLLNIPEGVLFTDSVNNLKVMDEKSEPIWYMVKISIKLNLSFSLDMYSRIKQCWGNKFFGMKTFFKVVIRPKLESNMFWIVFETVKNLLVWCTPNSFKMTFWSYWIFWAYNITHLFPSSLIDFLKILHSSNHRNRAV